MLMRRIRFILVAIGYSPDSDLIPPKPLPAQGLFISSISHKDASFSLQYLAPLPSTQPDDRPNGALTARAKIPGQTKASFNISLPTSILVSSIHSLPASLFIAISNAVGSSKSHGYLMPLVRDLIEATIKCKRELLLPWRYSFLLSSVAASALSQSSQHP